MENFNIANNNNWRYASLSTIDMDYGKICIWKYVLVNKNDFERGYDMLGTILNGWYVVSKIGECYINNSEMGS